MNCGTVVDESEEWSSQLAVLFVYTQLNLTVTPFIGPPYYYGWLLYSGPNKTSVSPYGYPVNTAWFLWPVGDQIIGVAL